MDMTSEWRMEHGVWGWGVDVEDFLPLFPRLRNLIIAGDSHGIGIPLFTFKSKSASLVLSTVNTKYLISSSYPSYGFAFFSIQLINRPSPLLDASIKPLNHN